MAAWAASSNARPCEARARSIRIGGPRPISRRTSPSARDSQPCSSIVRFNANAISCTVSRSVPSRSNNTADSGCPRQCAAFTSCIESDADRTVIAAHDGGMNLGAFHRVAQLPRDENIIDPPSDVARPRIREVTPPRVVPVALRKQAKGIHESRIHDVLESRALFVRETLLAAIRFWVGQIRLGMRDIEVAAENDRLGFFQLPAIREEGRIPVLEPQCHAAE